MKGLDLHTYYYHIRPRITTLHITTDDADMCSGWSTGRCDMARLPDNIRYSTTLEPSCLDTTTRKYGVVEGYNFSRRVFSLYDSLSGGLIGTLPITPRPYEDLYKGMFNCSAMRVDCKGEVYQEYVKELRIPVHFAKKHKYFDDEFISKPNRFGNNKLRIHLIYAVTLKGMLRNVTKGYRSMKELESDFFAMYEGSARRMRYHFIDLKDCTEAFGMTSQECDKNFLTTSIVGLGRKNFIIKPPGPINLADDRKYLKLSRIHEWAPEVTEEIDGTYESTTTAINRLIRGQKRNMHLPVSEEASGQAREKPRGCYGVLDKKGICYESPYDNDANHQVLVVNSFSDFLERWYANPKYVERDEFTPEISYDIYDIGKSKTSNVFKSNRCKSSDTHVTMRATHNETIPFADPLTVYLSDPYSIADSLSESNLSLIYASHFFSGQLFDAADPYRMIPPNLSRCPIPHSISGVNNARSGYIDDYKTYEVASSLNRVYGIEELSVTQMTDLAPGGVIDRLRMLQGHYYGMQDSVQAIYFKKYGGMMMHQNVAAMKQGAISYSARASNRNVAYNVDNTYHPNTARNYRVSNDIANYGQSIAYLTASRYYMKPVNWDSDEAMYLSYKKYYEEAVKQQEREAESRMDNLTICGYPYSINNPIEEYLEGIEDTDDAGPIDFTKLTSRRDILGYAMFLGKKDYSFYHQNVYQPLGFRLIDLNVAMSARGCEFHRKKGEGFKVPHLETTIVPDISMDYEDLWNSPAMYKPRLVCNRHDFLAKIYYQVNIDHNTLNLNIESFVVFSHECGSCPENPKEHCTRLKTDPVPAEIASKAAQLSPEKYVKTIRDALNNSHIGEDDVTALESVSYLENMEKGTYQKGSIKPSNEYPTHYFTDANCKSCKNNKLDAPALSDLYSLTSTAGYKEGVSKKINVSYRERKEKERHMFFTNEMVEELEDDYVSKHYKPDRNIFGQTFRYKNIVCSVRQDYINPLETTELRSILNLVVNKYDCCCSSSTGSCEEQMFDESEPPDNAQYSVGDTVFSWEGGNTLDQQNVLRIPTEFPGCDTLKPPVVDPGSPIYDGPTDSGPTDSSPIDGGPTDNGQVNRNTIHYVTATYAVIGLSLAISYLVRGLIKRRSAKKNSLGADYYSGSAPGDYADASQFHFTYENPTYVDRDPAEQPLILI